MGVGGRWVGMCGGRWEMMCGCVCGWTVDEQVDG